VFSGDKKMDFEDQFITKEFTPDELSKTRDLPSTSDYPRTREFPKTKEFPSSVAATVTEPEHIMNLGTKKDNKFVRFLKFVFVKNIGIKIAALATAGLLWVLIAGLG